MTFSEMLGILGVSNSFLTYHLENLGELVSKVDDGKYRLSSFGEAAMATLTKVEDIPTTAPHQLAETRTKKNIGRNVAIALGIICILLIAFTAYFAVTGISAQNSYNNLQNQNKQLQTWINGNETLLNQTQANNTNLQNQIDSLNSNVTSLQNQLSNFHIGSTENSTILANNEIVHTIENTSSFGIDVGWYTYMSSGGYVSIRVSSNNNSTYVGLGTPLILNSTYGVLQTWHLNQFSAGFGGTVVFPISTASWIEIYFGSSNGEATLTVTITTYY